MKIPFQDLLTRNEKRLKKEKIRVEEEIKNLDTSNKYHSENSGLQEIELESKVEDTELTESNNSLRKSLSEYLGQIKDALSTIQKKKYGICARCGKAIAPERLKADPSAIYCLSCAEIIERENEPS